MCVCLCVTYKVLRAFGTKRSNLGNHVLCAELSCLLKENNDGFCGARTQDIFDWEQDSKYQWVAVCDTFKQPLHMNAFSVNYYFQCVYSGQYSMKSGFYFRSK